MCLCTSCIIVIVAMVSCYLSHSGRSLQERGVEVDRFCLNRITLENKLAKHCRRIQTHNADAGSYAANFLTSSKNNFRLAFSEMEFMRIIFEQLRTAELKVSRQGRVWGKSTESDHWK